MLNRVSSSRESFAKQHYIRADFLVVHSQPAARPCQSRLHLISNPENLDKTMSLVLISQQALHPYCNYTISAINNMDAIQLLVTAKQVENHQA